MAVYKCTEIKGAREPAERAARDQPAAQKPTSRKASRANAACSALPSGVEALAKSIIAKLA